MVEKIDLEEYPLRKIRILSEQFESWRENLENVLVGIPQVHNVSRPDVDQSLLEAEKYEITLEFRKQGEDIIVSTNVTTIKRKMAKLTKILPIIGGALLFSSFIPLSFIFTPLGFYTQLIAGALFISSIVFFIFYFCILLINQWRRANYRYEMSQIRSLVQESIIASNRERGVSYFG